MPGKELGFIDDSHSGNMRLIDTAGDMDDPAQTKEIPSLSVLNKKVASLNQEYTAMLKSSLES